jgi:alpha-ribazole phosphatase
MIYLIRHTTPNVEKGICYGQTDLDITASFEQEASIIKNALNFNIDHVYTSPLQRCSKLAAFVFPNHTHIHEPNLMELNCGNWEMQEWDAINKNEIQPWMNDLVNFQIPNGESYVMLYDRIVAAFEKICNKHPHQKIAIVAHGGVLRSILSYITNTPLIQSFDTFKIHYGAVFELKRIEADFEYKALSNIASSKERHKPSYY